MPNPRNPSAKFMRATDTVSALVDGDTVNMDDLYVEASPGGTPKLTLAYLHDLLQGLVHPGAVTVPIFGEAGKSWTFTGFYSCAVLGQPLWYRIPIPAGATLTGASVIIAGSQADVALPATMPSLKVYSIDNATGGTFTQIGSTTTDTSTPVATYLANHTLSVTVSQLADALHTYWLELTTEASTNATTGMTANIGFATWTA